MVRLLDATLLVLGSLHFTNAGSLTFLKSAKEHQQVERHHKKHKKHQKHGHGHGEHHHHEHRGDCWAHRPVHKRFHSSFVQQTPRSLQDPHMALPGAGMHPDIIEPFQTVTKDGFLLTACVKDQMLQHGDKFGNGKHRYKIEDIANVSIVHYAEIIPKEDREKMTINRCFDFCRTVPNMVYFGLNMGRDCYCTPYYKPMAGDSSNCDKTCEGDPSQMCGGETMSSIFEMHSCDDTRSELEDVITQTEDQIFLHLQDLADHVKDVADEGTYDANELQTIFGQAGGPEVSNYMQDLKVYAGELLKASEAAQGFIDDMQDPYDAASVSLNRNLRDFDNIKVAEDAIKALREGLVTMEDHKHTMKELMKAAHPVSLLGQEGYNATDAAEQYYPIMYYADEDYKVKFVQEGEAMWHHPTTCTGNLLQIVFGGVADDCAHACDGLPGKCDGFMYLAFNDGICVLFESILTVQQWTGCTQSGPVTAPFDVQCMGKLSRLESVGSIAPREDKILEEARGVRQGTGGCAHCLKKMEKYERCYEYGVECLGNKYDMELGKEYYFRRYGWGHPDIANYANSCERIGDHNPGTCAWDWGRPMYYQGSGQWLSAAQVCPQCGYCKDNGRQSTGNPWSGENWEGDPIEYDYYYYYYW